MRRDLGLENSLCYVTYSRLVCHALGVLTIYACVWFTRLSQTQCRYVTCLTGIDKRVFAEANLRLSVPGMGMKMSSSLQKKESRVEKYAEWKTNLQEVGRGGRIGLIWLRIKTDEGLL